jgi:hypothetical protein
LEVKLSVGKSLVALDTDHIKGYVFATDTLKEIRGASSLLDRLNRQEMKKLAKQLDKDACTIYANGGSGLFLLDSEQADEFGKRMQEKYRELTAGGATITYIVQPLPPGAPESTEAIMSYKMPDTLALLRHRLREQKGCPPKYTVTSSHPLMRPCDSCGVFYAKGHSPDADERNKLYCQSCLNKRREDKVIKKYIDACIERQLDKVSVTSPLWEKLLGDYLHRLNYRLPANTDRPNDLNAFRQFRGTKDYIGLIYADANGMGQKLDKLATLEEVQKFAQHIDEALYWAMAEVISTHLPVKSNGSDDPVVFPFDILLMGGDDIVLVTPASLAMPVAHALAAKFFAYANGKFDESSAQQKQPDNKQDDPGKAHTLSIGVVLAPINYPFALLLNLVEDTLKFAKKDGSKPGAAQASKYSKTRVNFLVVSGNTSQSFEKVYQTLHKKDREKARTSFYATMRPYTLEQLAFLLEHLKKGNRYALGRSKLHQLREAILQKNLSTSVVDSLAVLRSWKKKQREFIVHQVYHSYPLQQWSDEQPATSFSMMSFPWHIDSEDGLKRHSTPLLDFIELYDFIAQEEQDEREEDEESGEA